MKWAEWKSVDGEDVAAERIELLAERRKRIGVPRARRRLPRQAQADAERAIRRDGRFDRRHMGVEALANGRPTLAGVDVGAIGQMDIAAREVIELHDARASC